MFGSGCLSVGLAAMVFSRLWMCELKWLSRCLICAMCRFDLAVSCSCLFYSARKLVVLSSGVMWVIEGGMEWFRLCVMVLIALCVIMW